MTQIDAFGFTFREINNGTAYELVKYSGSESRLKIPPAYNGKPILRIAPYAFAGCSQITDLVISEGVVEIGDRAFQNCTSLVNLQIPDNSVKGQFLIIGCPYLNPTPEPIPAKLTFIQKYTAKVNEMAGGHGPFKININGLFSGIFSKKNNSDLRNLLTSGLSDDGLTFQKKPFSLPTPWFFSRVFLILLIAFIIIYLVLANFGYETVIPAVCVIGGLVVPLSAVLFFYEVNIPRNLNIIHILTVFIIGGVTSLLLTGILNSIFPETIGDVPSAIITGIVEEVAKVMVVLCVILLMKQKGIKNYILSGILIGSAVGAGFAAFETAGYALMYSETVSDIFSILLQRSILSPGGHIAWAAISGGALMMTAAKKSKEVDFSCIMDKTFLLFFISVIVLHSVWDMGSHTVFYYLLLACVAVFILIVLLFAGFEQIKRILQSNQILTRVQNIPPHRPNS